MDWADSIQKGILPNKFFVKRPLNWVDTPGLRAEELIHNESRFASLYRKLLAHRYNLLIRPDSKILEIGCGMGELLDALHTDRKIGIDLSPEQIESLRKQRIQRDFSWLRTAQTSAVPERHWTS